MSKKDDVGTEADTEKKEGDSVEKLKKEVEKDDEIQAFKVKAETEKLKLLKKKLKKW